MAYYTDQEYTITNVAYVYDPNVVDNSDNRESLISRGTIKSGNVIFTAFKTIDSAYVSADSGATLGLVSSNCKLTFSAKPNGNPMPLAGMYLSTRTLQLVNNGSSVDDATGLTNVNTVTGNLRFCVASNKTLPVYNYPVIKALWFTREAPDHRFVYLQPIKVAMVKFMVELLQIL